MRIAVIGTGGVGGYFGGRLALNGEDVTFIARGAHLEAIRDRGLEVRSHLGDFRVKPASCTDDPATVGPVDLALLAVKLWDTESASASIAPLLDAETAIISFQNGVTAEAQLAMRHGAERIIGGVAAVTASIAAPGVIEQTSTAARLFFGELDGQRSTRCERLLAACLGAGIESVLSTDISKELWTKLVLICGFAGACAVTRAPLGPVMADPDTRALFTKLMEETELVARAKAVNLDADVVARHLAWAASAGSRVKPSLLNDLERGNRLEVEWLNGAVAHMGRELGIPTPANQVVWSALKLYSGGNTLA